ncbi:MAG: haloacid dehalogenase-like hydrolase [Phycisphaerales bacterium JB038]
MPRTIALIFDFDGTLAPDSTTSLLASLGIDSERFWREDVGALLDAGWDEMPAYLWKMIEWSQQQPPGQRLTQERLRRWGEQIEFFPGVESLFTQSRAEAAAIDPGVNVEFYLISSGIGAVLRATGIASEFRNIWASDFHCNDAGEIVGVRNVVSFTEKTRFIVQISKGIVGADAQGRNKEVNKRVESSEFAVPFRNMIVVGDGDTDVPMFAMVRRPDDKGRRGVTIGVSDPKQRTKWGKALSLVHDQRVDVLLEADYSDTRALRATLVEYLQRLARRE